MVCRPLADLVGCCFCPFGGRRPFKGLTDDLVVQVPPVLQGVHRDGQQNQDTEEGDPAQDFLLVGLLHFLALGTGTVDHRGKGSVWVQCPQVPKAGDTGEGSV